MTYAWWAGFFTVLLALIAAWRSEDWWAAMAYYAGKRAGTLARRRIQREEARRINALAGEPLLDEMKARWGV